MKSIPFSNALKCKRIRLVLPGDRFATVRLLNIPTYIEGETVNIKDKRYPIKFHDVFGETREKEETRILYQAIVEEINFKKIQDLTKVDAALDLFPEKTAEDFQSEILSMYAGRTKAHWSVQTVLHRCKEEESS